MKSDRSPTSLGMAPVSIALGVILSVGAQRQLHAAWFPQDANTSETTETLPQATEQQDLADEVARLRALLDSDQLLERVEAEQSLVALGPKALPFLEPATSALPQEQFDRLSKVRQRLEQLAAEQQSRASRCTLQGSFTLDQALESLQRQTGNASPASRLETSSTEFKLVDVSYWEAIAELERAFPSTQLDPYRSSNELHWRERADESPASVSSQSGPFRFEVLRIEAIRDLINPALSGTTVTVRVRWEPRMDPISVTQDLASLSAIAGEETLGASTNSATFETLINARGGWVDLNYVLAPSTQRVESLRDLIGSLTFTVPTESMPFRFTKLDGSARQEARTGSTLVSMVRASRRGELYGVEVRIRFDESAGSLESHRGWIFECPVELLDADGEGVSYFTYETTLRTDDEVGILYLFPMPDNVEDLSLVIQAPSAILRVPVNFSFSKIDLP